MVPDFLIPETVVRKDGAGPELVLGEAAGSLLLLTLGITRIIEQESLDVSVWGSADGTDWGTKPLASFPQKFYCGTYELLVDLTGRSEVKHLRAQWKVNRWGRGSEEPLFGFYLFLRAVAEQSLVAKSA